MELLKTTSALFSQKLNNTGFVLVFLCSLMISLDANGQSCCRGLNFNDFTTYCVNTGATPASCMVPANCSAAILDAAYGITGNWASVLCVTGAGSNGTCLHSDCGALPVELVEFDVVFVEKGIQLYWTTASETDNKGFDIERSTDGRNWQAIDFVPGNSTSFESNQYDYLDESPALGFNYYRLKQVDYDESFSYSPVKVTVWQGSSDPGKMKLTVLPNPAAEWMTVGLTTRMTINENIQFNIFDQTGKLVRSHLRDKDDEIRISLDGLPSGYYILNASQGQVQETTRFIKR